MRFLTRLTILAICITIFVSATPSIYLEYSIDKPSPEVQLERQSEKEDHGFTLEIETTPFHSHTTERISGDVIQTKDLYTKGQRSYGNKSAYY